MRSGADARDSPSILDRPLIRFGPEIAADVEAATGREWLVTNGLGGYASGTIAGVATRRYHALLVAALDPPVGRTVLVSGSTEWVILGERRLPLLGVTPSPGTIEPDQSPAIETFRLEGMLPVWRYSMGGAVIERRVWMANGRNVAHLSFRLIGGSRSATLEVAPLITERDHQSVAAPGGPPALTRTASGFDAVFPGGRAVISVASVGGQFVPAPGQWRAAFLREERFRGLEDETSAFEPGVFRFELEQGRLVGLTFSAAGRAARPGVGHRVDGAPTAPLRSAEATASPGAAGAADLEQSLADAGERQRSLLDRTRAGNPDGRLDPMAQQLILAADQFLVARGFPAGHDDARTPQQAAGRTVIAGYHWFNDWGRDTMIALPGLTLATGRPEEGAAILRSFAPYLRDGLLPNNFPDRAAVDPGYNTVDASLWYVVAIARHVESSGDRALLADLLPVAREIVDRHRAGTRFGIGMDADGLLRAGEAGLQLTWMDVKIGDWVVTPRIGKPVEINALWYNALRLLAEWLADAGAPGAAEYADLAERVRASFRTRYVRADIDHLADVIDGPGGDDWRLRPNQLFAVSLPHPLLEGEQARRVVESSARSLLTNLGLRTLDPADPDYRGRYEGDLVARDSAYHQGTVWTWLIGPFVEAFLRVSGDRERARSYLEPFRAHLAAAGLGTVSEILDGDPPHRPAGCIAQAWSVAEVLRVWRLVTD